VRIVMFYHSLLSDWNHGNAHFLRGVTGELVAKGHGVTVYEPQDGWSLRNLLSEHGERPLAGFHAAYPELEGCRYDLATLDLDEALGGAELVLVHEWNAHELVRRLGEHRKRAGGYRLLFHDTHHRAVSDERGVAAYDLSHYDGVLAFGRVIRDLYLARGWAERAWTWHEAADTRRFKPLSIGDSWGGDSWGDLVWIGNWGDEERGAELREFLLGPVKALGLMARVHGVRYPEEAKVALREAGLDYAGWLPNFETPRVFAHYRVTVHVPRRPYAHALPGIPTIRVFEALACGIPLICAPWDDAEGLFTPGEDFLVAKDGPDMTRRLREVLEDAALAGNLAARGRRTILERHTCAHRADELLAICLELGLDAAPEGPARTKGRTA
jgi:spore maturation protein CgeB